MKKYPVTYKGKTYEVRWKDELFYTYISIYEVSIIKIFKFKIKRYKHVYELPDIEIEDFINKKDPNYYIEETKIVFKFLEADNKRKQEEEQLKANKLKALKEWDGYVN